jgi:ABC-2 type transport system ATP-binding protein
MTPPAVRTVGLSKSFGAVRALDQLTLEIPRGTIFGLLGPNGSGKTTTIRLLLGLLAPTSGYAEVLGYDSREHAPAIRQRSGVLLEHCGLYERLTAADNLDLYGRFWRLPSRTRRARIEELLTGLGLWDRRGEIVACWSRGMKQTLAVARALLHRPELVFLDEPTAGLDPIAAAALRGHLSRLSANDGVTVCLTTHDLAEAERLCALVGIVRDGRLLAVAPPGHLGASRDALRVEITGSGLTDAMLATLATLRGVISARPDGRCLTVTVQSAADVPPVIGTLVSAGFQVESVHHGAGSLDDGFRSLMAAQS